MASICSEFGMNRAGRIYLSGIMVWVFYRLFDFPQDCQYILYCIIVSSCSIGMKFSELLPVTLGNVSVKFQSSTFNRTESLGAVERKRDVVPFTVFMYVPHISNYS
jgi:hypothetical protein